MEKAREWLYFGRQFSGDVESLLTKEQIAVVRRLEEMEADLPMVGGIPQSVLMVAHFLHLNEMRKRPDPYHGLSHKLVR